MNKGELVAFMAHHSGGSKADAERALNLVVESVLKALKKGNDINLVGFGSFNIRKRAARDGRNPKTGQKMRINAYKQPVFRAGKKMKEACN
jgi:DNA-binding protein HU-beta